MSLISFKNISKKYSGNSVLKNINIDIEAGEIHALIGENGAGKSTLMNILFGMPVIHETGGFEGTLEMDGNAIVLNSPFEAMRYGIGMVHQEFMLIPGFTVTENVKLNREITKSNLFSRFFGERLRHLDKLSMSIDTKTALDTLSLDIEEYTMVEGLPVGHMQFIEIAREIDKTGIKLLVLDEPTAVLTESEADNLLEAMRRLAATGIGIIFISHRLNEIVSVADRVTILRDGELITTRNTSDISVTEIAELMVGRSVNIERGDDDDRSIGDDIILKITDLRVAMPGEVVKGVNLDVRRGEILGIGGLAGQGKLGIANGIMGVYPASGSVVFDGVELSLGSPHTMLNAGLGFVSEDRKGVGLLLEESIDTNITFTAMQIQGAFLRRFGPMSQPNTPLIREHSEKMVADLDIRCSSIAQKTGRLSGGNQQKVCLARALTLNPKLLFVSEPTRGIDIGAKKLVLDLLLKLSRENGMTIIMTSSELAELRSICDNIAIVCEGVVVGMLPPDAPDVEFGLMMSGSNTEGGGSIE